MNEKEEMARVEEKFRSLAADDEIKPSICKNCGTPLEYSGLGEYKCPDCGRKEYDSYGIVRIYLEQHPGANILQVEKNTGIPRQKISRMISEDRFSVSGRGISTDK